MYEDFKGKMVREIIQDNNSLTFKCYDGSVYLLDHEQNCCENVYIESIDGPLDVLIGSPIILSEAVSNDDPPPKDDEFVDGSHTWTFVKFGTVNGSVTIRFFGTSNGYYSEEPDFSKIIKMR